MAAKKIGGKKGNEIHALESLSANGNDGDGRLNGRVTVERLLKDVEDKLRSGDYKPGIADLIRLLQLRSELGEEQPKEITVTWVEPETDGREPSEG